MKTFLALFLVAALFQVSTAPVSPNPRESKPSSKSVAKPQAPPPVGDEYGAQDDDTLDADTLVDDPPEENEEADGQGVSDPDAVEKYEYVQALPPKAKKAATTPPAPARKSNNSQNSPSNRVSSPNKQQTPTQKKAASKKTATADKTGSQTASNPTGLDMKSLDLGSLISSIAKMPSNVAAKSLKTLKDLTTTLPADSPAAALLNGLRFMFANQSMMQMLDKTFSPFNQAMSRLTDSTPGMLTDNPLSNAAEQIFAVAMKKSGTLIKTVTELADAAFENAKDATEDFEEATKGLEEIPVVGGAVTLGHGFLRGGLDAAHNGIANPTDILGTRLEESGNQMQSQLEKRRLMRQRSRSRSIRNNGSSD